MPDLLWRIADDHARSTLDCRRVLRLRYLEEVAEERGVLQQQSLVDTEASVERHEHHTAVLEPELGVVNEGWGRRRFCDLDTTIPGVKVGVACGSASLARPSV